jgi:hypothetical protein
MLINLTPYEELMSITPITSVQDPIIQTPTFFQKAKQLLSRRDVRIASVVVVAFAALFCTYLNRDKIMVSYDGYFNPNIDQQCVKELSKELEGVPPEHCAIKIMSAVGGIRGYCSLPKLDRNESTVIYDHKEVIHPLMRNTYNDLHYLTIKTEIACNGNKHSNFTCPDKYLGVEHLIWNKAGRCESLSPNKFFAHLSQADDRMQILEALYAKGSVDISRKWVINPFIVDVDMLMLPNNYSIKLKSTSDSHS